MSGWICLHRKLLDWEWYSDHNTKILFVHCLLRANHSDSKWKGQTVKRGQFITSLDSLSKETGLTISQVRTSIKKLKSTSEIAEKSQARSRVVTVLEYDTYQDNRKQVDSEIAGSSQDNRSEIATDNNVNNNNNETMKTKSKAKRFTPPTLQEVSDYCFSRKNGIDPQRFIDHYSANGWMRGKNKMKDWKACVRTWEGRQKEDNQLGEKTNGILNDTSWADELTDIDFGQQDSQCVAGQLPGMEELSTGRPAAIPEFIPAGTSESHAGNGGQLGLNDFSWNEEGES